MKTRKTTGKNFQSYNKLIERLGAQDAVKPVVNILPEIVVVTTFPPRECGIATYSEDLIRALKKHYIDSFSIKVCAVENTNERHNYDYTDVKYVLNTSKPDSYKLFSEQVNRDDNVKVVLIQHEFGLFAETANHFNTFINDINKPLSLVFHTVLPNPDRALKDNVCYMLDRADSLIVMTHNAANILKRDYAADAEKITVIPHGTHLVPHTDKAQLKRKYGFEGRKILSTFGLLSSGKSLETTLDALPEVINKCPEVLFLIIGKTHPTVALNEGEHYRDFLKHRIQELGLEENVKFINKYVALDELLEYLQMTDIYLFTSKDPNQAVSGTFSYALSCGCAIISTPIPHAKEVLAGDTGITFDFGDSQQLAGAINTLLFDVELRHTMVLNGLHKIVHTAWENSAVAHAKVLQKAAGEGLGLHYKNPVVNLSHIKNMTTDFGILQFSKINKPDIESGYTLDDNARALIAMCQYYKQYRNTESLKYIKTYLNFIDYCQLEDGRFLNYVDFNSNFTPQNRNENLEDSAGRAMWALGYVVSLSKILPEEIGKKAEGMFQKTLSLTKNIHSTRAMAFIIKGLYYYNRHIKDVDNLLYIKLFADRLVQMYRHEADTEWKWFEGYLTYANSVLPEALLLCYAITGNETYKAIAKESFDFLLSKIFTDNSIRVISNRGWYFKGRNKELFGEQPIDVAYTILALRKFHDIFKDEEYLSRMESAFNWFLGNNHLQHIVYNPCTGGCFDGLEEHSVNLNQGAESTVSYLMARLTINKYFGNPEGSYFRRRNRADQLAAMDGLHF
ncbi:mannosyltransferase [Flavobacterium cyanobacteriorum]|uniref:Mannosyltransferase n=1 Tax=Flavobacterium cyanobacteriorum TaxID=2022802 RepID=A0A255YUY2_9FLAO|nr:glycosyltransferase [Flavobacterium cyanobacteriorum]OYQ32240.1 mannosyltransferase [Flavobacterium cyanobacteriorum]